MNGMSILKVLLEMVGAFIGSYIGAWLFNRRAK